MPHKKVPFRVAHRRAGLGSLGRERYTALADWCGGKISREAKRLIPSACTFAGYRSDDPHIYYTDILQQSARSADPFLSLQSSWVLRRLSPYCSRVELASLARSRDEERLLWGMGRELANIHLGGRVAVPKILRDLQGRKGKWLRLAAGTMTEAMLQDWKAWRKRK